MTQRTQDRAPRTPDWKTLIETGADASSIGDLALEALIDRKTRSGEEAR